MTGAEWVIVLALGMSGLGMGLGLVLGAFVVRQLRRFMRDEHLNGQ